MLRKLLAKYKSVPERVRASFWFLVCAFMQRGIQAVTTPVFTRLLTTEEYGQYNVFNSWLTVITVIVSLNLFYGVYNQGLIKFKEEKDVFATSIQGLMSVLLLTWSVVYFIFRNFWNTLLGLTTVQMLAMMVMIWATGMFSFWSMRQRVDLKYRFLVLITIIISLAKPLLSILLIVLAEDKVTAYILGFAIAEIVFCPLFCIQQLKRCSAIYNKAYWIYAIKFNIPLVPHYLSQVVLNNSDRIMIQRLVSDSAAGIYSLAYSVAQLMMILNSALMQTIEPWMFQKISDRKIKDISQVAYPAFFIMASANLMLILFAPEVIAIFAPTEYYQAIWIIPPVAMSVFFAFSFTFFAVFEFYFEKTKYIAVATVGGAVLNLILNFIYIQRYGYYAAGYTTLICYVIYALFHFCFMQKICKDNFDGEQPYSAAIYWSIAVAFICIGLGILLLYNRPVLRYGTIVIIMIVAFISRKKLIQKMKSILSIRK